MSDAKPSLRPTDVVKVAQRYGMAVKKLGPIEHGYRNESYAFFSGGAWYNLMLHENSGYTRKQLGQVNTLGKRLIEAGLPVRSPADPRVLSLRAGNWSRLVTMHFYLPGQTIPWEAYTMKHIKLLGWALSDFHNAAREVSHVSFLDIEAVCEMAIAKMQVYFSKDVLEAAQEKLNLRVDIEQLTTYQLLFRQLAALPQRQILHMDFVRGNLLFAASKPDDRWQIGDVALTGILDLEKTAIGHPLIDIARTLTFLLIDCSQKSETQIRRYFLDSGYGKRGQSRVKPLSVELSNGVKCDVLETVVDYFLLYDFYKLLRSNPYESLEQNYHYRRTRDMMCARNLLHYM